MTKTNLEKISSFAPASIHFRFRFFQYYIRVFDDEGGKVLKNAGKML